MRITLFVVCFTILSISTKVWGQNPAAYQHVSNWTNFAEFSLQNSARPIKHEKGVTFEVTEEVNLTFQVLVTPEGAVRFVRPPKCAASHAEYRLGGTDALYGFTFEPVSESTGDQWITVLMNVKPDGAVRNAQ